MTDEPRFDAEPVSPRELFERDRDARWELDWATDLDTAGRALLRARLGLEDE